MAREMRSIVGFDSVRFKGPGVLTITQCDEEFLVITGPQYMMKNIESTVESTVTKAELHLGYSNSEIVNLGAHREALSYALKVKDIKQVVLCGRGRIEIPDMDNDQLKVSVLGSGELVLGQLTADRFKAIIEGSGSITVSGDVEIQSLTIKGSGSFFAENLVSDFADIRLSGSARANVSVSDELNATISGNAEVSYAGYPDIHKIISGSGSLIRRRKQKHYSTRGKGHG